MKVYKVADIVNKEILFCVSRGSKKGDTNAILFNLEEVSEPNPDSSWHLEIEIGQGSSTRRHMLDLCTAVSRNDSLDNPLFLVDRQRELAKSPGAPPDERDRLVFYRNRLFMSERVPMTIIERDEIILRTKKLVYDEEADLASLRAAVANIEASIEYVKSGPRRDPIPEDVKLLVWARDGGACVRCGSKKELHFDHIIPVAKGGGNVDANIQILCQLCNLKKADKVATL